MAPRFPILKYVALALAVYGGIQKLRGRNPLCFGVGCVRHAVTRAYAPEKLEFRVAGPYEAMGRTLAAVHTFTLGPFETRKGTGFGYDLMDGNDHGQDAKHFYLPPERLAFYHAEYLGPGRECPSSFMHRNLRIHMLVGASDAISERLRAHRFEIEYGGTTFAYEGHPMTYESSLADGAPSRLVPALYEDAYSNVGHARIPYDYFLVTGFARRDPGLPNPTGRAPAAADFR